MKPAKKTPAPPRAGALLKPPLKGPAAKPVAQATLPTPAEVADARYPRRRHLARGIARRAIETDRRRVGKLLRSALETGTMADIIGLLGQLEETGGAA